MYRHNLQNNKSCYPELSTQLEQTLASYPGSSQFFDDARRKIREPGKIHHVCDVRWKGLGTVHAHILGFCWEKHDGKTAGLSKLESTGTDMFTRAKKSKYTSDLSRSRFLKQ